MVALSSTVAITAIVAGSISGDAIAVAVTLSRRVALTRTHVELQSKWTRRARGHEAVEGARCCLAFVGVRKPHYRTTLGLAVTAAQELDLAQPAVGGEEVEDFLFRHAARQPAHVEAVPRRPLRILRSVRLCLLCYLRLVGGRLG